MNNIENSFEITMNCFPSLYLRTDTRFLYMQGILSNEKEINRTTK